MNEALSNLPEPDRSVVEQSEIGVTYYLDLLNLFAYVELFPFDCAVAHTIDV